MWYGLCFSILNNYSFKVDSPLFTLQETQIMVQSYLTEQLFQRLNSTSQQLTTSTTTAELLSLHKNKGRVYPIREARPSYKRVTIKKAADVYSINRLRDKELKP